MIYVMTTSSKKRASASQNSEYSTYQMNHSTLIVAQR